jgi:hypothetical protein
MTEYNIDNTPQEPVSDQQWRQAKSVRFDSYEAARGAYDASSAERKRVRARPSGKFDFVVYERLPKKKVDE